MLSKLLKYDFKSLTKFLFPVYGIGLLVALLARISNSIVDINSNSLLAIPNGFITMLFIIVLIGIPFLTFFITIIKFYQNLIQDEGYLMHTLPVKKSNLVMSKGISACVMLLVSVIVSIILLFVGVYGIWFDGNIFELIKMLWELAVRYNYQVVVVLLLITSVLGFIMQQFMFYAAIALGQKHYNKKIIYSLVDLIILYTLNQVVSTIPIIPMMFIPSWSKYINEATPPAYILNTYLGIAIVLSIIFVVVYYVITVKILDKKLNLE